MKFEFLAHFFKTREENESRRSGKKLHPSRVLFICLNKRLKRYTELCFILRPKLRNHRGDFESQIIKPQLLVMRHKSGNRHPWF
jgi:hypothetical protein